MSEPQHEAIAETPAKPEPKAKPVAKKAAVLTPEQQRLAAMNANPEVQAVRRAVAEQSALAADALKNGLPPPHRTPRTETA